MTLYQIPLTSQPNQSFTILLPTVDGNNLQLSFDITWNGIASYWQANIIDGTGTEVITALPLIVSQGAYANLFGPWAYLNIEQMFVIPLSTGLSDAPGLNDWGKNFILVWGTP